MARKEKQYHFIYKTTNILTGKYYYGMHSGNNLEDGYLGSGKRLRRSINKYGKENHKREIIEFLPDRKSLIEREKEIVNLNEIAKVDCMNLVVGGNGGFNVEIVKKGRLAVDNIMITRYGINWRSILAKKTFSDLSINKRNEINKKIIETNKKNGFTYDNFKNKKHTEETRKKLSKSRKGTGIGNKNSQFDTCWITKNGINKKIKKENLILYLKDNWIKGRKLKCIL